MSSDREIVLQEWNYSSRLYEGSMVFRSTETGVWGYFSIEYTVSRVSGRGGDVVEYKGTIRGECEGVSVMSIAPPSTAIEWEGPIRCSIEENQVEIDFEFLSRGFEYERGIIVGLVLESNRSSRFKFNLSAPLWLEYMANVLSTENDDHLVKNLISELEERSESPYSIVSRASESLPTTSYFDFCDLLIQHSDRFGDDLPANLEKYLRRLFKPDPKDPYAEGNRLEYVSAFNDTDSFSVNIDDIVSEVLEDTIQSKDKNELVWYADQVGSDAYPVSALSDLQAAVLLGVAVKNDLESQVQLFLRQLSTESIDDYESKKEAALDQPIQNRVKSIEDLLYEAHQRDSTEFRYLLTQYLVFLQNEYGEPEVADGYFETVLEIGADLAESQDLGWIKQKAEYSYAIEAGWRARHKNQYQDAQEYFSQALLIVSDPEGEWGNTADFIFKSLQNLTESAVFEQWSRNNYQTAAKILEKRREILEDIEGVSDGIRGENIRKIKGLYHRSQAFQLASTRQYDDALDELNSATAAFARAGLDDRQDRCIAMRHEIMALQQEVQANFDSASRHHDQFVDKDDDHPAAEYHSIRAQICQVKAHVINEDIQQASSTIRDIEEEYYLNQRRQQLADLVDVVQDYNASKITSLEDLRQPITTEETVDNYTVSFRDDYSVGIIAALAAQRFATYQFHRELLDELVTTAVHQAVVPNTVAEISAEELSVRPKIRALNPTSDWKSQLPGHVLHQLNDISNREQQIRGDYTGLLRDYAVALEQHFAVVIDYVGTQEVGCEWITELDSVEDPDTKPSLGHYLQFLEADLGDQLYAIQEIRDLIDNPVAGESRVDTLRNNLQHGYQPEVATGETGIPREQYNEIKATVENLMSNLILNTPVIAEVENQHKFGDGYQVRLHWGGYLKRTWIKTDASLSEGDVYYLPAGKITQSEVDVFDPVDLIECTEKRTLSHIE